MVINIGITGASGAIYARILAEKLVKDERVKELRLIFTTTGREVAEFEGQLKLFPKGDKIKEISNTNFYCSLASGSGCDDALVILPCSMGTVGRIAAGVSDSLLTRGADVMLKEGRKLIIVTREAPFSSIHLNNMLTLKQAGATVMSASPSFYTHAKTIEELCTTTVNIVLRQLGLSTTAEWPPHEANQK